MEISEVAIWQKYQGARIEFRDANNKTVGGLYTDLIDFSKLMLSNDLPGYLKEKYVLIYQGVVIYFTYYKIIEKNRLQN